MRKGQVTLYAIIGVAILLLFLLFLLFRRPVDLEPIESLPADFEPVRAHLLSCLQETTVEALQRMASHGGYLDPTAAGRGRTLRTNPIQPTESDLLQLNVADPTSLLPYYYYLATPNNCQICVVSTLIPTVEEMEEQVEAYVLDHLQECVNYGLFPDIETTAAPEEELEITLLNESVLFDYTRELLLESGEQSVTASRFVKTIQLPYMRYYQLAKQITKREIETAFLENFMLSIISTYGGLDAPLPPVAGYEEGTSGRLWIQFTAGQEFQKLLYSLTPSLQVLDTAGVAALPPSDDPYLQGFLNMIFLDLVNGTLDASEFTVSIYAPDTPLYFNVKPSKGQLIKPRTEKTGGIFLVPPRYQSYFDFFYDVSAPFIVEIRHEDALPNTDFNFLFALEANVRDNKNVLQWLLGRGTIPWSYDFLSLEVEDAAGGELDLEQWQPVPGMIPNISIDLSQPRFIHDDAVESLFCQEFAQTAPLTMKVFDAQTNGGVEGVLFTYKCGFYGACDVGTSEWDQYRFSTRLDTAVAQCQGGVLRAEKEGYLSVELPVSTIQYQSQHLPDLLLEPLIEKRIRFEKLPLSRDPITGEEHLGAAEPLGQEETAFVTLIRRSLVRGEELVSRTAFQSADAAFLDVTLVPGLYEVRAFYLDPEGRHVEKECMRVCSDQDIFGGCSGYTYLPEEDINITPAPWGGLELSEQTRLWQLERSELYAENELVIPLLVFPDPECIDDLEDMDGGVRFTRKFSTVMPRFE